MSEFAPEWPVEADAIAGNMDHLDVDAEPDYGYDDEGDLLPWEQEAAIDPQSPEFQQAASAYALEHVQSTIEHLIQEHIAPLGAQMEAALEQQDVDAGMDQAYSALEEWGVAENDRQAVIEITVENLQQAADQIGTDIPTFLLEWDRLAGGDGSGQAAALTALELGAASLARAHEHTNAKDEFAVYDLHFRRGPLLDEHGPTTPLQPSTPGDEFGVLRKWFPNG
jgi:hypothetical protein